MRTRVKQERMHAALTRTQPTRRSCELRLALADWLHRRLMRGGLHAGDLCCPATIRLAQLRSLLQSQLDELNKSEVATAPAE